MNVDLEAGGELVTAGLAAQEIDKGTGQKSGQKPGQKSEKVPNNKRSSKGSARTQCANCNTKLVGTYCQSCGQPAHVHRSLWHMFEEGLHGVLHFDTKSWRTLPLLVARPGLLTKRYINGQRVRYVSPLALFLFSTFLMFFAYSLFKEDHKDSSASATDSAAVRAELATNIAAAKRKIEKKSDALAKATKPEKRGTIEASIAAEINEQMAMEAALVALDQATALAKTNSEATPASELDPAPPLIKDINIETGNDKFDAAFRNARKNPDLTAYKLKNTAYKFSFLLIPISLPFLWLMFFWKRDIKLYDHAIFSLYSLSFMSLLFALLAAISAVPVISGFVAYFLWLPPLHMFLQLRETYGLTFGATLWRTFALLFVAGVAFLTFLGVVAAISQN